jgi:hypothetical protein
MKGPKSFVQLSSAGCGHFGLLSMDFHRAGRTQILLHRDPSLVGVYKQWLGSSAFVHGRRVFLGSQEPCDLGP